MTIVWQMNVFLEHQGRTGQVPRRTLVNLCWTGGGQFGRRIQLTDNTGTNQFFLDRGYTGHEHLDEFGLINMNGRMYDPQLGRMLSPDNYVQNSTNTQGFNRYSYCLNNPLVYTDPSGEFVFTALLAPVGLAPVGFIIDAACWSAAINASIQGIKIVTGSQQQFNWAELGGAAVGGAVFGGIGLLAPTFAVSSTSFMTNLPTYLSKAGWAALAGSASTGAGMLATDYFDNGQIDFSGEDYLKAMGFAGSFSFGLSFTASMYHFMSWDRYSIDKKLSIIERKFSRKGVTFNYDKNYSDYGYTIDYKDNTYDIFFGKEGFASKRNAIATTKHELNHVVKPWGFTNWSKRMFNNLPESEMRFDIIDEIAAKKAGMSTWGVSPNYWFSHYNVVSDMYKPVWFSFGIDQFLSIYY